MGIGSNKIASLQYEIVIPNNIFTITIVDNNDSPVVNTQVHCTTNGQNYTTNSSGQIPQIIETDPNIKSLQFTWSTSGTGSWTTANGSLQQRSTITNNYTGVATITTGNSFNGNCITTAQTSSSSNYRINAGATVGNYITIGTRQYIIADVTSSIVYVILRYWEEDTPFNSIASTDYQYSDIAFKCEDWYFSAVPSVWKTSANAFTKVSTEGVSAECFIPTYSQANGGWDYFNSDSKRVFTSLNGTAEWWWLSTEISSSRVWRVDFTGDFTNNSVGVDTPYGFRPALAIKRSLFTS